MPARSRPRPLRDLLLAFGFLTVLPVGREWPEEHAEDGARDMVAYFPYVGAFLGGEAVLVALAVRTFVRVDSLRALITGALVVLAWALTTRFFHWDGLADTADALGVHERERRLEVMRDSRVGAFGVAAVVLIALLQTVALGELVSLGALGALLAAPIAGRLAAVAATWAMRPARKTGLGVLVHGRPSVAALAAAFLALLALAGLLGGLYGLRGLTVLAAAAIVAVAVPLWASREVGGLTGDILGATVLATEAATLAASALLLH